MNLAENEQDWLARHLGHDIKIHRQFYRQHDSIVELAKVSRLLYASENGQISENSGKALSDLAIPDLEVNEDSNTSDEEEVAPQQKPKKARKQRPKK
jgi:hypothetical protein